MVQYRFRSQPDIHQDYWKLPNKAELIDEEQLSVLRPKCQGAMALSYSQTVAELSRRACGQFEYMSCELAQLKVFCEARMIAYKSGVDKKTIIRHLQIAGEESRFRLMDLPPELRVRICELYFGSFAEALEAPVQPPTTMVSKLVRHESLSIFYRSVEFVVNIETLCGLGLFMEGERLWKTSMLKQSKLFWTQLPQQHLGFITKLRFDDRGRHHRDTRCSVDLGPASQETKVRYIHQDGEPNGAYAAHKQVLLSMIKRMTARPRGKALRRGDIEAFVACFDQGEWQEEEGGDDEEEYVDGDDSDGDDDDEEQADNEDVDEDEDDEDGLSEHDANNEELDEDDA